MNTPPITLTFFTLADFIAELQRRDFGFVRCEAITMDSGSGAAGPWRKYIIELTAFDETVPEVLSCPILVGETWATFARNEPHSENLAEAKKLVVTHLSEHSFTVLPGVYHHEKTGVAGANLWHWDKDRRLVPNEAVEPFTVPTHWDCECESKYIHPKSQERCKRCGAHRDEQPDSRAIEVASLPGVAG